MVIHIFIFLSIWCMKINGEPFYSTKIEDRLNTFEERLKVTELLNQKLGSRLVESEMKNQELENRVTDTEMRNQELELTLKNTQITMDSKFQEVSDKLELTEAELKQTKEKLKDTEGELMHTKVELKSTCDRLTNTEEKLQITDTELKSTCDRLTVTEEKLQITDAEFKQTSSKLWTMIMNVGGYDMRSDKTGSGFKDEISKFTNGTNIFDTKVKYDADEPESKIMDFQKVKRGDGLGSMVAFHVELGTHKTNFNTQRPILFDTVRQNFGSAYDSQLGVFTCPTSGLYFFTFTIMSNPGKYLQTKLVLNGSPIAYASSGITPTTVDTGTKSVIVPLHVGDRVWLEYVGGDNSIVGAPWSTITGFIIKET